jgi:hypothetical protein
MPLVDITFNPGYALRRAGGSPPMSIESTRYVVQRDFAQMLPRLLVENARKLMLDLDTPPEGVQVQNHDYGEFDVNIANVWIKIQLSESQPDKSTRIRDALYDLLVGWFISRGLAPENFVMDLLWGPTSGKGVVNGVEIAW